MFAIGIMCIGIIIFEFFPEKLLSLFDAKENMMNIGKSCLRIIAPSFIGAAMSITFSSVFQAMGRAVYSMIISIIRQLAVLLPTAYLLALTGNINNVWFCFLINFCHFNFSILHAQTQQKISSSNGRLTLQTQKKAQAHLDYL